MNRKDLDEILEKNFSNVNLWLNFAEAKNAANIAFVVACIAAIFSLQSKNAILFITCVLLIGSGMSSLISFLPMLGNKERKNFPIKKGKKKITGDNLIFFENIKKYSVDDYIKQISKMYWGDDKFAPTKYQIDLSEEIVCNSNIASRKYKLFKIAVYLDIVAFLLLAIFIMLA